MAKKKHPYHEKLLHWIWQQRHFEHNGLQTTTKEAVVVHDPGRLNETDGPDFTDATVSIGNLRWHGDVELHWQAADWYAHHHQYDSNFNNVILHVVFDETSCTISRSDDSIIPTLCLSNFISKPLHAFLKQYRAQPQLPCAGLSYISEDAFADQLTKAHREYFEQKVNDLLEFYDPDLPLSQAWKKLLAIALFDGFGISHNRIPMRRLADLLYEELSACTSSNDLKEKALNISEIGSPNNSNAFQWNHRRCRPGNHPKLRIQQGADCLWHIHTLPFKHWIQEDPEILWNDLRNAISTVPSLGKERASILFGTVFLTALYLLGTLLYSDRLKNKSWSLWLNHKANVPSSLLRLLKKTNLPSEMYAHKLGTVYQLRTYCKPKNCQDCKVFKKTISS